MNASLSVFSNIEEVASTTMAAGNHDIVGGPIA